MQFVQELRRRLAAINAGFSAGQRAVVGITVVVLIVGGLAFGQWASKPSYSPLYSNL